MGSAYDSLVWVSDDSRRIKPMWPLASPFPRSSLAVVPQTRRQRQENRGSANSKGCRVTSKSSEVAYLRTQNGCGDGSAVTNNCYSFIGPKFNSQHSRDS